MSHWLPIEHIHRLHITKVCYSLWRFVVYNLPFLTKKIPTLINWPLSLNYQGMLTKLHAWSLIEYDQIIYYDSDFVFLKNPVSVLDECGNNAAPLSTETSANSGDLISRMGWSGHAPLCASVDRLIGASYFNSGFMIITPNMTIFDDLIAHRAWADNTGSYTYNPFTLSKCCLTPLPLPSR